LGIETFNLRMLLWAPALSAAAFFLLKLGIAIIREARRRQVIGEFRGWAKNAFSEFSIPSREDFPIL
jgi:hypothetical protein